MDVQAHPAHASATGSIEQLDAPRPTTERPPSRERIGQALGEWQQSELNAAWRFPQCRGLSHAQLEDLYQETVLALLNRPFFNERHLRNALRLGLRNRALHVHRDERRRGQILHAHAPEAHRAALVRSELEQPESAALRSEDGLVVLEFVSELTDLEQRIYGLEAEGLRYRAIAPILDVDVNEARKASRSLQRKISRFQLLHDTGRLCGYRAPTIRALLAGEQTSEQLAHAAFAHVRACARCREEHHTNATRLRHSFQQRAAAVLPAPMLAGHLGWIDRSEMRIRTLVGRWLASGGGTPGAGVRERAIALASAGGVSAKIAAGAATVVAVAGGTIGASSAAHHAPAHARRPQHSHTGAQSERVLSTPVTALSPSRAKSERALSGSHPASRDGRSSHPAQQGFGFLGVPASPGARVTATARVARSTRSESVHVTSATRPAPQHGGGPFSP